MFADESYEFVLVFSAAVVHMKEGIPGPIPFRIGKCNS
jgi:hypothetical protein